MLRASAKVRPYLDYHSIGVDYCIAHEGEFLSTGYAGIRMGAAEQVLEEQGILHLTLTTAESWYYLTCWRCQPRLGMGESTEETWRG